MERSEISVWTNAEASSIRGALERAGRVRHRLLLVGWLRKVPSMAWAVLCERTIPGLPNPAVFVTLAAMAFCSLSACGTSPAKDFSGPWHPINSFQSQAYEIPLQRAYTFYAAPMDETLKTMLGRWARDTGRTLDYRLGYDVTLYEPVAGIRTTDIDSAVRKLSAIFAAQDVLVLAHPRRLVVQATTAGTGSPHAAAVAGSATGGVRP